MATNSINNIYNSYLEATAATGNVPGNNQGIDAIAYDGEELLFTETDGDIVNINVGEISDSLMSSLNEKFGVKITKTEKKDNTNTTEAENSSKKAEKTSKDTKAEKEAKIQEAKAKITENKDKLKTVNEEVTALNAQSAEIKATIEKLSAEIEEEIAAAVKKEIQTNEEEQQKIQLAIQEEIAQYKKDKEDGKPVTIGTLKGKIQAKMQEAGMSSDLQDCIGGLVETNAKIREMESLLGQLGTIEEKISECDEQIKDLTESIKDLEEICQEEKPVKRHDPIGYTEDGVSYEFVVDRDNSGDLTDVSEFLGAENNFDEMTALDTDGSGDVNKDELANAGVKVLVKNKETNTQELKSLDEVFGDDAVSIDTANYTDLSEQNVLDENGQQLLGNFNITIGDKTLEGYSTLDTDEYLAENYTFSGQSPSDTTNEATKALAADSEFIAQYKEKVKEYDEQMAQIMQDLQFGEELIAGINEAASVVGTIAAQEAIEASNAKAAEAVEARAEQVAEQKEEAEAKEAEEAEQAEQAEAEEAEEAEQAEQAEAEAQEELEDELEEDLAA